MYNEIAPAQVVQPTEDSSHRAGLDCAIVVPTLNERDNVPVLVDALAKALVGRRYEVIFVDDWSSDGTPDVIASLATTHTNVRMLQRFGRRGLSTAVIEGALSTMAPIVAVIDADMQHDEKILPHLIDAITSGGNDVAIGSRYCADGSVGDWDETRAQGSRLATWLSQKMLRTTVTDPMSGFFAVRRDVIVAALPKLSNMGFKVLLDVLASSPSPLKIAEIPYQFRNRHAGTSKLDSSVAVDFIMMLLDKKIGWALSPRLIMFSAVGALGLFVHLGVLRMTLSLLSGAMLPERAFEVAQACAVTTAIAFNFWLNNSLTYHDRRLRGTKFVLGLLSFYAVCGLGALANIGVGSAVFRNDHRWWLAGIAGAIVGSAWNYVASSIVTWRKR